MITDKPTTVRVLYQYKDSPEVHEGFIAYLTSEHRWLLDIDILEGEVDQEWIDFDESIFYYLDLTLGDTLEELMAPDNPYEFCVLQAL